MLVPDILLPEDRLIWFCGEVDDPCFIVLSIFRVKGYFPMPIYAARECERF